MISKEASCCWTALHWVMMMKMKQQIMMCLWLIQHLKKGIHQKMKLEVQGTYASLCTRHWILPFVFHIDKTMFYCCGLAYLWNLYLLYSFPSSSDDHIPCCMIIKLYHFYFRRGRQPKADGKLCTQPLRQVWEYSKREWLGTGHSSQYITFSFHARL